MPEIANAAPVELVSLAPDSWTAPFWEATAEHRLIVQRCTDCGTVRQPPGPFCPSCRSQAVEWQELSGQATLYSFTVIRHALIPLLRAHLPMVIAVVEPDDAPAARLVANLVEVAVDAIAIGMPLEIVWTDVEPGVTVYRFRPPKGAPS